MARGFPTDIAQQARSVLEAWRQMSLPATIGEITPAVLEQELQALSPIQTDLDSLDAQLTDLRNRRDALGAKIWDHLKRIRGGVKANYGDDSSQYEMVGGTRKSERKPPQRKAKQKTA